MTQETKDWILHIQEDSRLLNYMRPERARYWRKQAGLISTTLTETTVTQTTSIRVLNKGVGVSIQIDETSTLDQVIDFAFHLQMMRSAETISQEIWQSGADSIQQWLSNNGMDWNSFLAAMKSSVA
jgi:hypothetical protein